jgi:tetrapyrrole methylase family protein/MazG family protein
MSITIVGLGPGDPGLLTVEARAVLASGAPIWLRTAHHPTVAALPVRPAGSFDDVYEQGESFDAVYSAVVERVTALGCEEDIVYAVPGSPLIGEATVQALLARAREGSGPAVRIVQGLSFLEPVCAALDVDPLAAGIQLVDALDPRVDPSRPAILAQLYNRSVASGLKLALLELYPAEHAVTVVRAAGLPDQQVETLPLAQIDRRDDRFDHLACLYVPALDPHANLRTFEGLRAITHTLRSPQGCPWDREQTHATLKPFLLEETYEVLAALDDDDPVRLREEFGDLLLQMTLHTEIAEEAGEFTYGDVFEAITTKLLRRHPHVFAGADIKTSDEQWKAWQSIKRAEKGGAESILAGVPASMPALAYAQAVQERAARAGFDWPNLDQVLDKLVEELGELRTAATHEQRLDEFGDVLFVLANVARWLKLDAEEALRRTNRKFYRRFSGMEELARRRGLPLDGMSLAEMEALYQEVKAAGVDNGTGPTGGTVTVYADQSGSGE